MTIEEIKKLMHEFEDSDLRELELDQGDLHLRLSKNQTVVPSAAKTAAEVKADKTQDQQNTALPAEPKITIDAPLVGTVYLQSKPGQPPYVQPGDRVKKGQTICIIEAMKMMTEVKADKAGVVAAVKVEDGDLVEVGQPLLELKEE